MMNTETRALLLAFLACGDFYQPDMKKLEESISKSLLSVSDELGIDSFTWGPVAHKSGIELFSDALVFVVKNKTKTTVPTYSLVIRGTNPFSVSSWIFQDLDTSGLVPWTRQSPHAKASDTWISCATDTSMELHTSLAWNGSTIIDWLINELSAAPDTGICLDVCGHSLGGLMSTTFALWLRDEIAARGLADKLDMHIYAFAGPTAGNAAFAAYSQQSFGNSYQCYRNKLDIATHVWTEYDMFTILPDIYAPTITLKPAERKILDSLCTKIRALGYTQLPTAADISSSICTSRLFDDYLLQAAYQHVVPYAAWAFRQAPLKVAEIVLKLLEDLFKPAELLTSAVSLEVKSVAGKNELFDVIRTDLRSCLPTGTE
jgi:hypothetical protein